MEILAVGNPAVRTVRISSPSSGVPLSLPE
jgi:hypothetical protein